MNVERPDLHNEVLNPLQKNSLRISLMLIEKGMLEVDRLLSDGEHEGILFRITDDLREETKTDLWRLIHELRQIVREMKDRFQLDLEIDEKSRAIFGKVPLLWEIVTDTDANRLRGYGKIDPALKEVLDPSVERLSRLLLSMHQLVAGRGTINVCSTITHNITAS